MSIAENAQTQIQIQMRSFLRKQESTDSGYKKHYDLYDYILMTRLVYAMSIMELGRHYSMSEAAKGGNSHDQTRSNVASRGWNADRAYQRLYLEAHQRLGANAMKIDLKQPSTKKGLALVGAGIALATGHPELLTASVTPEGVQMGGLIGVAAPILVGLWEAIRDEFNG